MLVEDSLASGKFPIIQPAKKNGYRFNIDPLILAALLPPSDRVLDLGSGCGILALALLDRGKAQTATAVERQPILVRCLRENQTRHGLSTRLTIFEGDLREFSEEEGFDAVVFNPPYFPQGQGRGSQCPSKDEARHERHGGLWAFVSTAASALKPQGLVMLVLPYQRETEALALLKKAGFSLQTTWHIRARQEEEPHLCVLHAIKGERPAGALQREATQDRVLHLPELANNRYAPWLQDFVDSLGQCDTV